MNFFRISASNAMGLLLAACPIMVNAQPTQCPTCALTSGQIFTGGGPTCFDPGGSIVFSLTGTQAGSCCDPTNNGCQYSLSITCNSAPGGNTCCYKVDKNGVQLAASSAPVIQFTASDNGVMIPCNTTNVYLVKVANVNGVGTCAAPIAVQTLASITIVCHEC